MARAVTIITKPNAEEGWFKQHGGFVFMLLLASYALLFLPFWKPVILGFLFASASGPLQVHLRSILHSRRKPVVFGILVVLAVSLIALLVLFGLQLYSTMFQAFDSGDSLQHWTQLLTSLRDKGLSWLREWEIFSSLDFDQHLGRISNSILNYTRDFVLSGVQALLAATPQIALSFFIFVCAFSAFLFIGSRAFVSTANVLGIEGDHTEQFNRFEKICALSLGSVILTGIMQASIVTIGALFCSLGNYFLIFAATFILSMIPLAGGALMAVVLGLVALVQGDFTTGTVMLTAGGIASVSDNVLKAWLFSKAAETNPMISIISLLGGVTLFGFAGLFIAPVIEQLVMAEFHSKRDAHKRIS